MCPCQNVDRSIPTDPDAGELLEWMTYHHLPLQLWCEADDGSWVVVDASSDRALGFGGSAEDALQAAYKKELDDG